MKKERTELAFILDKSGSMNGLEVDTIGGYNSMLAKQQAVEGECQITTVLFDNNYELLHDRIDIRAVRPITGKDYFVGANIDAVQTAGRFGIASAQAADYRADGKGTQLCYQAMSATVAAFRKAGTVDAAYLEEIRKDAKQRGCKNNV